MARTLHDGFHPEHKDRLRSAPATEDEWRHELDLQRQLQTELFEKELPHTVRRIQGDRRRKGLDQIDDEDIMEQLRAARRRRSENAEAKGMLRSFQQWARSLVVESMKNSIQAMFYACDYSTKPNMNCSPLLVAIRDGLKRLEDWMRAEEEEAKSEELVQQLAQCTTAARLSPTVASKQSRKRKLSKEEDEARRRLIRQAQAANQAIVKGNCLMVMQMLTGREVLRTHFPWQLMMKHSMWMALQQRREMQGFDETEVPAESVLQAAEAASSNEASSASEASTVTA